MAGSFELENENFRAALEWLIETDNAEWGLRLGVALFPFLGNARVASRKAATGWETLKIRGDAKHRLNGAHACDFCRGSSGREQGDYAVSDALFKRSLEIARQLEDQAKHRRLAERNGSGSATAATWRLARALRRKSGALERTAGCAGGRSRSQQPREASSIYRRTMPTRALYEECLAIFRELGDNRRRLGTQPSGRCSARPRRLRCGANRCTNRAWRSFANSGTAGASPVRWPIWGIWPGSKGNTARRISLYRESCGIPGVGTQARNCAVCWNLALAPPPRNRSRSAPAARRRCGGAPPKHRRPAYLG